MSDTTPTSSTTSDHTETAGLPSEWTTKWDDEHTFPFVEDENANITGYGHQNPAAFAAAVREYDAVCGEVEVVDDELWEVAHRWVTYVEDNDELLHECAEGTPGAFPVTTVWGQR